MFSVLVGLCFSDVSLNKGVNAPYPASGSGPTGARLNTPAANYGPPPANQYGAPPATQQRQASEIEVTPENVEFAQQVVEVQNRSPAEGYLPPAASRNTQVCSNRSIATVNSIMISLELRAYE